MKKILIVLSLGLIILLSIFVVSASFSDLFSGRATLDKTKQEKTTSDFKNCNWYFNEDSFKKDAIDYSVVATCLYQGDKEIAIAGSCYSDNYVGKQQLLGKESFTTNGNSWTCRFEDKGPKIGGTTATAGVLCCSK